ncbi:hypothetical protein D0859_15205, partial [Hortaea werneckii]
RGAQDSKVGSQWLVPQAQPARPSPSNISKHSTSTWAVRKTLVSPHDRKDGYQPYLPRAEDSILGKLVRCEDPGYEVLQGLAASEIQQMYSLNMPVSQIRTKIRQEFERHRYVSQIKTVDVLLFNSHQEFQETLNFWKQLTHVLKYFRAEEDPKARLPKNFIQGFIEVQTLPLDRNKPQTPALTAVRRAGTENVSLLRRLYISYPFPEQCHDQPKLQ